MDYANNDHNILYYDGEWENGKHEGQGFKLWMDNVRYQGEWSNGMMHGKGVFHMNEVDMLDGLFEMDEFCG
jgi:1-phosphatidylinositol-4-phosphate 5-kinase